MCIYIYICNILHRERERDRDRDRDVIPHAYADATTRIYRVYVPMPPSSCLRAGGPAPDTRGRRVTGAPRKGATWTSGGCQKQNLCYVGSHIPGMQGYQLYLHTAQVSRKGATWASGGEAERAFSDVLATREELRRLCFSRTS